MAASVERDYQLVLVSGGRVSLPGACGRPAWTWGWRRRTAHCRAARAAIARGNGGHPVGDGAAGIPGCGDDLVVQQGQVRESRVPVRLLALQVGRGADL
jgi:hypothetical protein